MTTSRQRITIGISILAAVLILATGVAFALRHFAPDRDGDPSSVGNTGEESRPPIDELDPSVDITMNNRAKAVSDEADVLITTDPAAAKDKYIEAAAAYERAGNASKTAEMRDNATTAESLIPPKEPEPVAPPVVQMDVIPQ